MPLWNIPAGCMSPNPVQNQRDPAFPVPAWPKRRLTTQVAGPGNPGCLAHHGYGKFILAAGQCLVDQGKDGGRLVHGRSPCFRVPLAYALIKRD